MCVWRCMCVCISGCQKANFGIFLRYHLLLFGTILWWPVHTVWLGWLASECQGPDVSASPELDFHCVHHHTCLFCVSLDIEHSMASTSATESTSQTLRISYMPSSPLCLLWRYQMTLCLLDEMKWMLEGLQNSTTDPSKEDPLLSVVLDHRPIVIWRR